MTRPTVASLRDSVSSGLINRFARTTSWKLGFSVIGAAALITGCAGTGDSRSMDDSTSLGGSLYGAADYNVEESAPNAPSLMSDQVEVEASQRQLVFRGEMSIVVEDLDQIVSDFSTWVVQNGGFVESSQTTSSDSSRSVRLVLRIASEAYESLRSELQDRAIEVRSDWSERVDVTAEYADVDARLKTLRLAETELRELLAVQNESGGDVETVLAIYRELRQLRTEIDGLQAQLDVLDEQIALSTLTVRISSEVEATSGGGTWRIGRTFRRGVSDLVSGAQNFAQGLIYFLVAVVPMLLLWGAAIGVGLWVVTRAFRFAGIRRPSFRNSKSNVRHSASEDGDQTVIE